MDREISALKSKELAIPAGDKTQLAEIARIEGQIQAVRDKYAELNIQLSTDVAKTKANLEKVQSEESRKLADALSKSEEQDEKKKEEAEQRHAVSVTATDRIIEAEAQRHAAALVKIHESQLQDQFDLGLITQNKLLNLKQKELDEEYKAQLAAINKERSLLDEEVKDKGSDLYANRKAGIDSKQSGIVDDHAIKSAANSTAILKNEIKQIGTFLTPISNQFSHALSSWVTGTKTFSAAFAGMTQGIVGSWVNSLAQMTAAWAQHQATKLILHILTNAGLIASTAATAAATKSINSSLTISEVNHAAVRGAANTFASVSKLPPPLGQILAPIAAAGTYAAILGLGLISAEGGADLGGGNSFAMLHPREMVLPQKLADNIRNMTTSNTNSRTTRVGAINYNAKSSMGQREFRNMMTSTMRNLNI